MTASTHTWQQRPKRNHATLFSHFSWNLATRSQSSSTVIRWWGSVAEAAERSTAACHARAPSLCSSFSVERSSQGGVIGQTKKKVDVRKDSRSVAGSSSHPPPLPSSQKTFSLLMAGSKASTGLSAYAACWLSWGPPLARAGSWPWWALALACPACPLPLPLQPLLPFFLVFFVDAAQRPKLHPVERCYAAEWGKATQIYFGTAIRRLNTDRQQQP